MMLVLKTPPAKAKDVRDTGLIPGLGRYPGRGHGNPLQCSCLENPLDRGTGGLQSRVSESDMTEVTAYTHAGLGNPALRAGLKLPLASEGPHRCPSHATKDCYLFFSCWQCLRLPLNKIFTGICLVPQQLRFCAPSARGTGSIPG